MGEGQIRKGESDVKIELTIQGRWTLIQVLGAVRSDGGLKLWYKAAKLMDILEFSAEEREEVAWEERVLPGQPGRISVLWQDPNRKVAVGALREELGIKEGGEFTAEQQKQLRAVKYDPLIYEIEIKDGNLLAFARERTEQWTEFGQAEREEVFRLCEALGIDFESMAD